MNPEQVPLIHRYSFNVDVSDSVGGDAYAATLMDGAYLENNQVVLPYSGPYVNLPATLLSGYSAVSIEAWVTTQSLQSGWVRLFQVGQDWAPSASLRVVRSDNDGMVDLSWGSGYTRISSHNFDGQLNMHIVYTMAAGADYERLYVNGQLAVISNSFATYDQINDPNAFYIGKSLCDWDPGLAGSLDEFRVWGGVLSSASVFSNYAMGPGSCSFVFTSFDIELR